MVIQMYDAENVEFKFSRLRRHLKFYSEIQPAGNFPKLHHV